MLLHGCCFLVGFYILFGTFTSVDVLLATYFYSARSGFANDNNCIQNAVCTRKLSIYFFLHFHSINALSCALIWLSRYGCGSYILKKNIQT